MEADLWASRQLAGVWFRRLLQEMTVPGWGQWRTVDAFALEYNLSSRGEHEVLKMTLRNGKQSCAKKQKT